MSDEKLYQERLERAQITTGISNQAIYRKVSHLIASHQMRGELLEYGAGSGQLLSALAPQEIFSTMTGIDILPRPASLGKEINWIQCDLSLGVPLPDRSFQTILSTEVIEHLENPRAVVREWARLLKPGGWLIVTTPNQESFRSFCALIFGGHYAGFLGASYPAHITALLRLDLERILKEAGFASPDFSYTDEGGLPKLPWLHWQKLSLGLLRGRLWSDNVIAVARRT